MDIKSPQGIQRAVSGQCGDPSRAGADPAGPVKMEFTGQHPLAFGGELCYFYTKNYREEKPARWHQA